MNEVDKIRELLFTAMRMIADLEVVVNPEDCETLSGLISEMQDKKDNVCRMNTQVKVLEEVSRTLESMESDIKCHHFFEKENEKNS